MHKLLHRKVSCTRFWPHLLLGWHPYQGCHEKHHLDVFGCVGFLARRFIRGILTLFEIPNKSFVLYAFVSKNRHEQDSKEIFLFCIFFPSCFVILQLCVCFHFFFFSFLFIISSRYYKHYSHIAHLQYTNTNRLIWCNIFLEISSK